MLDLRLFSLSNMAVSRCGGLTASYAGLTALECPDLSIGQGTRLHALLNALFLIHIALHISLQTLG